MFDSLLQFRVFRLPHRILYLLLLCCRYSGCKSRMKLIICVSLSWWFSLDWLLVRITPSHEGLAPSSPCGVAGSRSPEPEPCDATWPRLRPQEGQQVFVELLLVREGQAVGRPRIDLQGGALDDLGGEQGRVADRHDLVVVAVDDQSRNVELLEVFGEVRLREDLDAVECAFETSLHRPQPEHVPSALRHLRTRSVGPEEGGVGILVELRTICTQTGAELIEHLHGRAAWIGRRLEHQRGYGAHQHSLSEALCAVAADVASHLAAAHGMTDQHRLVQIKCVDERRQVVSVVVHVVAVPGLAGSAMAATVMGDGAIAVGGHEERLVVPDVGIERPAMAEDDGLARAPVLVKNRGAVLGGNGTRTHAVKSSF